MRNKTLLVAAAALVLFVVGLAPVFAQGPGGNPIYATIEYVDGRISELTTYVDQHFAGLLDYVGQEVARLDARIDDLGGGSVGEDFGLAPGDVWTFRYDEYCNAGQCWVAVNMRADETPTATYHGRPLQPQFVPTRGHIATADPTSEPSYGAGDSQWISLGSPSWLLQPNDQFHIHLIFFWMGTEKEQQFVVNADECGPDQDPSPEHTVLDCPVRDL